VIVEFFKKPGIWVSIIFIILFRAGEAQVQSIGPLFLREARELGGLGLSTPKWARCTAPWAPWPSWSAPSPAATSLRG
jgi:hypothetical protein